MPDRRLCVLVVVDSLEGILLPPSQKLRSISACSMSEPCRISAITRRRRRWQGVMSGMGRDATFDVVTADLLIQVICHDIWSSKKINKERDAKHKARRAMRRVARLKNAVGVSSARELFIIGNIRARCSSLVRKKGS